MFHKFVVNHKNEIYQETRPLGDEQQDWTQMVTATRQDDGAWFFEAAIPLKYLELKDGEIVFNLLRYRPDANGTAAFSWGLIPLEDYMDPKWFGSLML